MVVLLAGAPSMAQHRQKGGVSDRRLQARLLLDSIAMRTLFCILYHVHNSKKFLH